MTDAEQVLDELRRSIESVRRGTLADDPDQWHATRALLYAQLGRAEAMLGDARERTDDNAEVAALERSLEASRSAIETLRGTPNGWRPVSRESELLAIVNRPSEGGAKIGWDRKEAALKAELDLLSPSEAQQLRSRLVRGHVDDPLARALSPGARVTRERYDGLLAYLGDARKRAAIAHSLTPQVPRIEARDSDMDLAAESFDDTIRRVLESDESDDAKLLVIVAELDDGTRSSLAHRIETYRPGNGDDVAARFARLDRSKRDHVVGALRFRPST